MRPIAEQRRTTTARIVLALLCVGGSAAHLHAQGSNATAAEATAIAADQPTATDQPAGVAAKDARIRTRHEIAIMERVLEQKVQLGAQMLSEQLRAAGMPDVLLFAGVARARGLRLEGYGMLFDLDVPIVRMSMAWSLRMMGEPDPDVAAALSRLRELGQSMSDSGMRSSLRAVVDLLDARVGTSATAPWLTPPAAGAPAALRRTVPRVLEDPSGVYTEQVRSAVIDAMFDHSGRIQLEPGEWLTVAAREGAVPRLLAGDANDLPSTMILRVRQADVTAFREGRLSREEAVQRVEVSDF